MQSAAQFNAAGLVSQRRSEAPVVGMILFIIVEAMFFSALISAYLVTSSQVDPWPPTGMPVLPAGITLFNTGLLLTSGIFTCLYYRHYANFDSEKRTDFMFIGLITGALFLLFQGTEWVKMIDFGTTYSSNIHSSFFFLVIGTHGLHVLGSIIWLAYVFFKIHKPKKSYSHKQLLLSACLLWYFVVLVWPFLYYLIYIYPGMVKL